MDGGRRRYPRCSHELVLAAKRNRHDARTRLVEDLRPLVSSVARQYRDAAGVDHGELMQEGAVGILRALERYDPDYGTPFWAYAAWWVRQAMQRLVAELSGPVVLSDRALRQLARVRDARSEFIRSHGSEPSTADLAHATGLAAAQVERLLAVERTPQRLDEPLGEGRGTAATFQDLLSDPRAEDEFDRAVRRLEAAGRPRSLLEGLSERERTVVSARFGLCGPRRTLREIAAALGLSAERVRQIEQEALERLRVRYGLAPARTAV